MEAFRETELKEFLTRAARKVTGTQVQTLVAPLVPDRGRYFPVYVSDKARLLFDQDRVVETPKLQTPSEAETYQYDVYLTDRDLNKYLAVTNGVNRISVLDARASAMSGKVPTDYTEPDPVLPNLPRRDNATKTESVVCLLDAPSSVVVTEQERKFIGNNGDVAEREIREDSVTHKILVPDYAGVYAGDFAKTRHEGRTPIVCSYFAHSNWQVDLLSAVFLKEYDPLVLEKIRRTTGGRVAEKEARERNVELFRPRRAPPEILRDGKTEYIILGATPPAWRDNASQRESQCIHESIACLALSKDPAPYICFVARKKLTDHYWRYALEPVDAIGAKRGQIPRGVGEVIGAAAMTAAPSIASGAVSGQAIAVVATVTVGAAAYVFNKARSTESSLKIPRIRPKAMTGNLPHEAVITHCPMGLVYCAEDIVRLDFFIRPQCTAPEVHNSIWVMQLGVQFDIANVAKNGDVISTLSEKLAMDVQKHVGMVMSRGDRPMLDAMSCCEIVRGYLTNRPGVSALYGICMQYPVNFVFG